MKKSLRFNTVTIELGWFGGNDFVLLGVEIYSIAPEIDLLTLFGFQVAKFCFSVHLDYESAND